MNEAEVNWSRNFFSLLKINAVWGVPRSGLIFKKVSKFELALHDLMPWTKEIGQGFQYGLDVPPTKEELRKFQQSDFETIASRFVAAGVKITDPKGLLKD